MSERASTKGREPISDDALAAVRFGVEKACGVARIEKNTALSLLARLDKAEAERDAAREDLADERAILNGLSGQYDELRTKFDALETER